MHVNRYVIDFVMYAIIYQTMINYGYRYSYFEKLFHRFSSMYGMCYTFINIKLHIIS